MRRVFGEGWHINSGVLNELETYQRPFTIFCTQIHGTGIILITLKNEADENVTKLTSAWETTLIFSISNRTNHLLLQHN